MTQLIDGKAFAATLRNKLKHQITTFQEQYHIQPGLAVILVGEDPASQVYVANKQKFALECGLHSITIKKETSISEDELLALITSLNEDHHINGILVQLPLPKHINSDNILKAIDPLKDVDGFHPVNIGQLSIGKPNLIPCTPLGSLLLLKEYVKDLEGKNVVVIGRSNIVGKPIAQLLLSHNCTVTIAHSRTKNIEALCQQADIIIAAVGQPKMVKAHWVKDGAVIIDVGINRISENGKAKLVGDVDFEDVKSKVAFITPVPGGVGPMTIACLLQNTLTATCLQHNIEDPNKI